MKPGTRGAAHRRTDNAVLRQGGDHNACLGGGSKRLGEGEVQGGGAVRAGKLNLTLLWL